MTSLGDMTVVGEPPKLWKALAVIEDGLHSGFDQDPRITGISKESCMLAGAGFPAPVV